MKFNIRHLSIFLFCVAGIMQCNMVLAQLPHIVKDYNNCTEGLQNDKGEWIVQPIYESIAPFAGNRSIVRRSGLYGVIDITGKEVVAAEWADIKPAGAYGTQITGLFELIGKNDTCALIDSSGKRLLTTLFPFNTYFIDSVSIGTEGNTVRFVHFNGLIYTAPRGTQPNPRYLVHDRYEFVVDSFITGNYGQKQSHQFHGVLDSKGNVIVPAIYEHVKCVQGTLHPVIAVFRDPDLCGYYSMDGKMLWDCKYTSTGDYYSSYYNIMDQGFVIGMDNNKFGVMGWNGDTLLPFAFGQRPYPVYLDGTTQTDTAWLIFDHSKFGIYSSARGWIFDTLYRSLMPIETYRRDYGKRTRWLICCKENKYGCLDVNNDTIVPFQYTSCTSTYEGMLFVGDSGVYLLRIDYSEGAVGIPEKRHDKYFHEVSHYPYIGDDAPNSGVMPGDTLFEDNTDWDEYYMYRHPGTTWKKHNKWSKYDPYPYLLMQPFDPQPVQERLDTLPGNSGCTVLAVHRSINVDDYYFEDSVQQDPSSTYVQPFAVVWHTASGQSQVALMQESITDSLMTFGDGFSQQGLMTNTGHVIFLPGVYVNIRRVGNCFIANDSDYQIVILDSLGNLLARPGGTNGQDFKYNQVWIAQRDSMHYMHEETPITVYAWKYRLFDLSSLTFLTDTTIHIIEPFNYGMAPIEVQTTTGTGIIDRLTLKFIVAPYFARVEPLESTGQYYAVETCNRKVGIVDSNSVLLADTIYDNLTQLLGQRYFRVNSSWQPDSLREIAFLLSTDSSASIFSSRKGMYAVDSTYTEVIRLVMLGTKRMDSARSTTDYSIRYDCQNCKSVIRNSQRDTLLPWQNHLLYDILYDQPVQLVPFPEYPGPNSCRCADGESYPISRASNDKSSLPPVSIFALGDSVLSLKIFPAYNGSESQGHFTSKTFILFADGAHDMTLDSLFTGTAWQNVITDSLLSYLSTHKNIDADCSRPGYMVKSVNAHFLLQADGLHVYPEWDRNTDGTINPIAIEVVIPWQGLNPYLRTDVIGKIPGK